MAQRPSWYKGRYVWEVYDKTGEVLWTVTSQQEARDQLAIYQTPQNRMAFRRVDLEAWRRRRRPVSRNPKRRFKLHTGPRGGKYIIRHGRKVYH